jgi:peptide/nickel transport system substrate-binding protein
MLKLPRILRFLLVAATTLLVACAPTVPASTPSAPAPAPKGPKTVHMALPGEPPAVVMYGLPTGNTANHVERWLIFHAGLTAWDFDNNPVPRIASKIPSLQDGDWKINADGSMDVTWKLRSDVRWHDGAPLTADDFAFGYRLALDKRLAVPAVGDLVNVTEVQAVDPYTLAVHWATTTIWANGNERAGIPAVPKHLLIDLYEAGDPLALDNSNLWTTDWIGLGPFKLTQVVPGSLYEGAAFDQYFLGRPKIDRLYLHWLSDINVVTTQLLAGAVDVVPVGALMKPEQVVELRRTWAAQGKGAAFTYPTSMKVMAFNFRDPNAPWVRDVQFRRAMLHGFNRDSFVNDLLYGLAMPADYFVMFDDPLLQVAEQRGFAKYPYDPTRAAQLFAQAGWTMGADKLLHDAAGETVSFRCCRKGDVGSNQDRESLAVVSDLKAMGIEGIYPLPSAPAGSSAVDARKFEAFEKGGQTTVFFFGRPEGFATLISPAIATEANRWLGPNAGGWTRPRYDELQARAAGLLDATARQEPQLQMLQIIADDVPFVPMYYNPAGIAVRAGVEGIQQQRHTPRLALATSWNIETWDVTN